jgi:glutamyl-tRNA reductase
MTVLSCLSVSACHAPLDVLERLSYSREELARRLTSLRTSSQSRAIAVLSTCERTEVYATWPGEPDHAALLAALAEDRGVTCHMLRSVVRAYRDEAAARHLLRVACGLESFVLGETEIAGQVRVAADISRAAGGGDAELDRLLDAAISASRKRQRQTSILAATRSVAGVAVDSVTTSSGGTLTGKRVLVVGAGQVASVVVARAIESQAAVTVCNRSRRRADRFVADGAAVMDLADLPDCLAATDAAILATAAPHPLVDARMLRSARSSGAGPLTLVDLSLPRNVDPAVRALPGVRLLDLADLRSTGMNDAGDLAHDLAATEQIIEAELRRYLRWLAGRSAAAALRRMRRDAENIATEEMARIAGELPPEIRSSMERVLLKTVHRLVHKPTLELRTAAAVGDRELVTVLAGLFDTTTPASGQAADGTGLLRGEPDTTGRPCHPLLDLKRRETRAPEQTGHESGVHSAHKLRM